MESTFFHLSAEKIQWLDMEWMQAGARSPQFPGDNIQHSQPYYFPLLIMSLSSSRSPRSPRTSVHNCCDVSVPQSERQVKCPNHVSCHRFSPNDSSSFSRFGDDGCPRSLQAFLDSISPNLYFRYRWERLRDQWEAGRRYPREHSRNIWIFPAHLITSHSSQISDQLRFMQIKQ